MSGRIRGHYRIDSSGRVEPLGDVNGSAKPYTIPLSVLQKQPSYRRSHMRQLTVGGAGLCMLGFSLLVLMPQIQRAVLTAQAMHLASVRATLIQQHPPLQAMLAKH